MSDRTLPQSGEELRLAQERSKQHVQPPTESPGYEPERLLGTGAYGEVWVATDRNTGRRVAIKFYAHRGGLDWSLLSREVEKLAFLFADRYVVQLIDVAWDAEPPYYVMEYLEAGSLEDRLAGGALPMPEAVALFRDVGVGLVHAHGKGVLHCDLKPANVLLDQDLKPRLADFGQSRLSHEQTPALGTLFYMAPEQADLAAAPDARWDVYALGALFYCMVTGRPPYRTEEVVREIEQAGGLEERLARYRQLIQSSPRPNAHRRVEGVDRELADIIDRCLDVHPSRRFPNVQVVLNALDQRDLRRARRPLLILGALGPALLLLVMSAFAWSGFNTAIDESDQALTKKALESNHFAAQLVAETVAQKIDRRWQVLEQEAADPEFRQLMLAATGKPLGSPERDRLQRRVEDLHHRYPEMNAASCFVNDEVGAQQARSPLDPAIIDQEFSYRDYFHGQGRDLPPETQGLKPITDVHRSNVFTSISTGKPMVAFSVPVWSARDGATDRRVLGVLAMTVHLGDFAELRSGPHQLTVLVDTRPDSTLNQPEPRAGRKGSILEHPRLADVVAPDTKPQRQYLATEQVARLEELRRLRQAGPVQGAAAKRALALANADHYADPLFGEAAGRWLAAIEPVFVKGRPADIRDTGWVVIVEERYDAALAPIQQLASRLVRRGMVALGVVIAVLTALWGFVVVLLTESSRSRWLSALRRHAGLSTPSFTGSTLGTPTYRPRPSTPAVPTASERSTESVE